jgi:hypothetical protein
MVVEFQPMVPSASGLSVGISNARARTLSIGIPCTMISPFREERW